MRRALFETTLDATWACAKDLEADLTKYSGGGGPGSFHLDSRYQGGSLLLMSKPCSADGVPFYVEMLISLISSPPSYCESQGH